MKFKTTLPAAQPYSGHVHFSYNREVTGCVVISRENANRDNMMAEVSLVTLAKLAQAFSDSPSVYGVNGLSLQELTGVGGDFPLAFAEITGFIDAFTRHRATEAIKKTLANLETSSAEELIKNFEGIDLWDYLALHDEPKPSPLV